MLKLARGNTILYSFFSACSHIDLVSNISGDGFVLFFSLVPTPPTDSTVCCEGYEILSTSKYSGETTHTQIFIFYFSINSYLASGDFCHQLIDFANSFDADQDRHFVGPDLDPNCLTL